MKQSTKTIIKVTAGVLAALVRCIGGDTCCVLSKQRTEKQHREF